MIPKHCVLAGCESTIVSDGFAMFTPVSIGVVTDGKVGQFEDTQGVFYSPETNSLHA
jgi:hypothetical protein